MAGRGRGMVSKAKKAGGDGLLLTGEQTNGYGIRQRKHDHDHRDWPNSTDMAGTASKRVIRIVAR
jgi:hypothetical protein